jgi:hypothetical protein
MGLLSKLFGSSNEDDEKQQGHWEQDYKRGDNWDGKSWTWVAPEGKEEQEEEQQEEKPKKG